MWWGNVNWTHTGKTRLLQLCVYIFFIYIYIYTSTLQLELSPYKRDSMDWTIFYKFPQLELFRKNWLSAWTAAFHSYGIPVKGANTWGGIALNSATSISTPTEPNPFFHFETSPKSKAAWSKWWVEDNSDSSIMLFQWQYSLNFVIFKPEGMLLDHPSEVITCS